MQRISIFIIAVIIVFVGAYVWKEKTGVKVPVVQNLVPAQEEKLSIIATFYPLEDIAKGIGNERVEVRTVVPAGAEPHEFEPTQQQILSAYQADIFLLNGAGIDPWAEKVRPELESRGIKVLQMSEVVTLLPATHEEEEEHAPGEEEEHEESAFDPHYWLDPVLVQAEVKALHIVFVERDKKGKAVYDRERAAYLKKLENLDAAYKKGLESCKLDTIVTSHNAFSYLAKRYGFNVISISGISPEAEPSPRRLAEIAQTVRAKGIQHIFFETLVSPRVSETLARETGAETLVFNPIEGLTDAERQSGENYFTLMQMNLDNLKTALQCQK